MEEVEKQLSAHIEREESSLKDTFPSICEAWEQNQPGKKKKSRSAKKISRSAKLRELWTLYLNLWIKCV